MIDLYGYWRSSTAYRVRIALNLKGLEVRHHFVNLRAGEQKNERYRRINALGRVPTLVDDEQLFTQSLAILEYLEECYPEPPLLSVDVVDRARVRALAQVIACDIHPINNLNVLKYLKNILKVNPDERQVWYQHWVDEGFTALEAMLAGNSRTGRYCHSDTPGLADLCLVPQVYNARRCDCDLTLYPTIVRIDAACTKLDAFRQAAPEAQPDAQK